MRSLHLTILIFCQILLASFLLYTGIASASPVVVQAPHEPVAAPVVPQAQKFDQTPAIVQTKQVEVSQVVAAAPAAAPVASPVATPVVKYQEIVKPVISEVQQPHHQPTISAPIVSPIVLSETKPSLSSKDPKIPHEAPTLVQSHKESVVPAVKPVEQQQASPVLEKSPLVEKPVVVASPVVAETSKPVVADSAPVVASAPPSVVNKVDEVVPKAKPEEIKPIQSAPAPVAVSQPVISQSPQPVVQSPVKPVEIQKSEIDVNSATVRRAVVERKPEQPIASVPVPVAQPTVSVVKSEVVVQQSPVRSSAVSQSASVDPIDKPVYQRPQLVKAPSEVKGGLGPLHLLANTLCSYQPEKPVSDETLNVLYSQRASVRKALFEFMSLKFTSLEKFSSRLGAGLEVVPPKLIVSNNNVPSTTGGLGPSHGWPVVGKCTAHDLKLMAEAAWCDETSKVNANPAAQPQYPSTGSSTSALDNQQPAITSNHHRTSFARSLEENGVPSEQAAVLSKILNVNNIKDAPVVESSIANLNLTQQQIAAIEAQASSTRACRRNALRLTKALFNHLAENQQEVSESWPKLYAVMSEDDCARKRMIDIVNALASFRGEASSIRRDNLEFAFAMDDLRAKVLETEVNVPLTFDKQFIEVEQFLQQSVKLMLANINPDRARLTSMRYRSLMAGPVAADDQCIELHQRLLAKNYPDDYLCNPNQFGQLPDVLRMAAGSLELWSIDRELNRYSSKLVQEYPSQAGSAQVTKQEVDQCIANLVSS